MRRAARSQLHFDHNKVCNYWKGRGHWKAECPVKSSAKSGLMQVKVAALVRNVNPVNPPCVVLSVSFLPLN